MMNHCYELIRKLLLLDEQNVAKQEESLGEFHDDLETIDRSIQNFTMNYQQMMSMLESKHMLNQENLSKELDDWKQKFIEERYQLQGNHQLQKKEHENRIFHSKTKSMEQVLSQAKSEYDSKIIALTIEKTKLYQTLEEKIANWAKEKETSISKVQHEIRELNKKKVKDLEALSVAQDRVEVADTKKLKGTELEEARAKRRVYHRSKTEEIERIFNINKFYAEKIIEKEAIISKIETELKMTPDIWMAEAKIKETQIENEIKIIENKKNDFLEKEEVKLQYLEKKERDAVLFEEEETIESLKETKIKEEFVNQEINYRRKVDRNNEIVEAAKHLNEYHIETIESSQVFLDTLISSSHKMMRELMGFESKRLFMQVELLTDLLNQHLVYLTSMITKEVESLGEDFKRHKEYLDFDAKTYSAKYHIIAGKLIKESSFIVQQLKKQIVAANDAIQEIMNQLMKQFDEMKEKSTNTKSDYYQSMIKTKEHHHKVLLLFRRNYIYKLEEHFALQKVLTFKEESKPNNRIVSIHQEKEKLFDAQDQALESELSQIDIRTQDMITQISILFEKNMQQLSKDLDKKQKRLQDYLDGFDLMVDRQKKILLIQLEDQKKTDISKI